MKSVPRTHLVRMAVAGGAVAVALALSACGGSSGSSSGASPKANSAPTTRAMGTAGSSTVLPVKRDPIQNTSTAQLLRIQSMLVENNVDPATKKAVADHLELVLQNTGSTPLSGVEVYYTVADKKTKATESYYVKLPASFSIPAGGSRTVHFDNTGAPDHFPVNKYGLYSLSPNALTVKAEVSANGAAVQTDTVAKSAGTGEQANQ